MATTVTVPDMEVTLDARLASRLKKKLQTYATQKKALDEAKDALAATQGDIADLREMSGLKSFNLEGYGRVTLVEGVSKKIEPKLLLKQGVTLEMIAFATVETPKKPFTKVTVPGQKDED